MPSARHLRLFLFILLAHAASAAAQDFTALPMLDTTDPAPGDGVCGPAPDHSRCSLRAAIQEVNALGGAHVIHAARGLHFIFGPAGDDAAASGDLDIRAGVNLVILGVGVGAHTCDRGGCYGSPGATIIDARTIDRAFHVHGGATLRLQDLLIMNGGVRAGWDADIYTTPGGAILNERDGDLTLDNVAIIESRAHAGGALLNHGRATVRFSAFTNNGAASNGGAISSNGPWLELVQSVIHGNSAGREGGGVALNSTSLRPSAMLRNVALTGNGTGFIGAGLFVNNSVTASVIEGVIAGNFGNGVYTSGLLTIDRTTIERNRASGISNHGALTVTLSNILSNHGSGIYNRRGVTMAASTIARNFTEFDGGGLYNVAEGVVPISLTNVTISGNRAARNGGGIHNLGDPINLLFVTITDNTAASGAGIFGHSRTFEANGTVIAGNHGEDCYQHDAITSSRGRFNIDGDGSCDFFRAVGDPMLGPLADNGGRTLTHLPLDGSPLVDAVIDYFCHDWAGSAFRFDQRGIRRPAGADCDAGAVEVTRPLPPWATLPPRVIVEIEIVLGRFVPLTSGLLKHVTGDAEAEGMAMKMAHEAEAMSAAFDAFMASQDAFAGADAIDQLAARLAAFTKLFDPFEQCCAQQAAKEAVAIGEARADLAAAVAAAQAALAPVAHERLTRLVAKVGVAPIAQGIKNSLLKQLNAQAIGAFIHHVEALRGKNIDAATADALVAEAKLLGG